MGFADVALSPHLRGQIKAGKGHFGQHRTESASQTSFLWDTFGNTPLPLRGGVAPFTLR